MTAGNSPRLSLAALVATEPGQRPRLIDRTHTGRRHRVGRREDFTEADYARLDAAHQQLGGPVVPAWDNLKCPHQPRDGRAGRGYVMPDCLPAAARRTRVQPVEAVWPHLKRSLANHTKQNIHQLAALIKTRLKRMQYRPGLLDGYLAKADRDLQPP